MNTMNTAEALDKNYYSVSSLTLTQNSIEFGIESDLNTILAKECQERGLWGEIYGCF